MIDYLFDNRIVRVSETGKNLYGENQYDFNIGGWGSDELSRQDLFTISVLIQRVLSGIEE